MAKKTRERILQTARRMFNDRGYGNVTTAALADEVGISEGNLWYHFNNKRALLVALADEFLDYVSKRLEIRPDENSDVISEYTRFLGEYAKELRDFRFLYRDQADYGEHSEGILDNLPLLYDRSQAQLLSFYRIMVDTGELDWPEERLPDLALNAKIIIRYSLEYLRETGQPVEEGSGAVQQAFTQHLTLFEHKLKPAAAEKLRTGLTRVSKQKQAKVLAPSE